MLRCYGHLEWTRVNFMMAAPCSFSSASSQTSAHSSCRTTACRVRSNKASTTCTLEDTPQTAHTTGTPRACGAPNRPFPASSRRHRHLERSAGNRPTLSKTSRRLSRCTSAAGTGGRSDARPTTRWCRTSLLSTRMFPMGSVTSAAGALPPREYQGSSLL